MFIAAEGNLYYKIHVDHFLTLMVIERLTIPGSLALEIWRMLVQDSGGPLEKFSHFSTSTCKFLTLPYSLI